MDKSKVKKAKSTPAKVQGAIKPFVGLTPEKDIVIESDAVFAKQTVEVIITVDKKEGWKGFVLNYQDDNGDKQKTFANAARMLQDAIDEGSEDVFSVTDDVYLLVNPMFSGNKGKYSWKK